MNKNLILKEWKEKLWVPVFALVFLVLFAIAAGVFSADRDFPESLTAGVQFFFLPLVGVLLGASAFSSELKDGSWAYLFSRPIKKSTIWLSKFAALAFLLAAVVAVYFIILPLVPGLRGREIELSSWGNGALISFAAYLVSFSLSFLSEKTVLTFFLTLFILFAFLAVPVFLLRLFPQSLTRIPFAWRIGLDFFIVLGVLAFGAASLYAFCRKDFSRPQSKNFGFLKSLAVFLAIGTVVSGAGWLIARQFPRTTFMRMVSGDEVPVVQINRGIFRYDPGRDRMDKIFSFQKPYWLAGPDIGGGKIAWVENSVKGSRPGVAWDQELRVMEIDGRNKRSILRTSDKPDSPLAGDMIYHLSVSPDGKRLILISYPGSVLEPYKIYSLSSDGTGLRFYPPELAGVDWINGLEWSSDSRRILFAATIKPPDRSSNKRTVRYLRLDLETGEWSAPPEDLKGIYAFGAGQGDKLLVYFGTGAAEAASPKEILRYYDIDTNAISDIIAVPGVQLACWSPEGDRFAFLADSGRRLGIVSVSGKSLLAEAILEKAEIETRIPRSMAWTSDGQRIVLADFRDSRHVLRVFDRALREVKAFPIPLEEIPLEHLPHLYPAGKRILVMDFSASRLWSFDPASEKWKKLF